MMITSLSGVQKVLANLKKAQTKVGAEYQRNLKRAALFVQRESQKVVPVDTGNLKNSAFTRVEGRGLSAQGYVGYTANYAIYVHENLESKHKPGKIAKFIEVPVKVNRKTILLILAGKPFEVES